jgi:hypothetical protein
MSQVRLLNLAGSQVSDAGLVHLKKVSGLTTLDLRATNVTAKGVNDLRQSLPACTISVLPEK